MRTEFYMSEFSHRRNDGLRQRSSCSAPKSGIRITRRSKIYRWCAIACGE